MTEVSVPRERGGAVGESSPIDRPSGRRRGDRIVGACRAMQEVVDQAVSVARSDRPVLITGPAGVGKEHLARAVHAWSARSRAPFLVVSCTALGEDLLARELFGCAPGAHAALPDEYPGALSRAAGGSVLLDFAEHMPGFVAEGLARALGEGRLTRQGDGASSPLRARLLATALEPPERSPFGDLPHHALHVPPLSERREDILPLAAHFLRLHAEAAGVKPVGFTADARTALLSEEWSGNVRELSERIRLALELAGNGAISAEALLLGADGEEVPSFKEAKRAFETRYVTGLLRRCDGNISRAARLAKKDRKDFYDVIRRTGVDPSDFR